MSLTNPFDDVATDDVRINVSFYDEDAKDGSVAISRAAESVTDLRPSQPWGADRRSSASATYLLPRGVRAKEHAAGHDERYYGFIVRVLFHGQVQDEWALPRVLLSRVKPPAQFPAATNATNLVTSASIKVPPL